MQTAAYRTSRYSVNPFFHDESSLFQKNYKKTITVCGKAGYVSRGIAQGNSTCFQAPQNQRDWKNFNHQGEEGAQRKKKMKRL
jgi:hypothetical protein